MSESKFEAKRGSLIDQAFKSGVWWLETVLVNRVQNQIDHYAHLPEASRYSEVMDELEWVIEKIREAAKREDK